MTSDQPSTTPFDVSRETTTRLEELVRLLQKWNPAINLVSKATLGDAWSRHVLDSVQIYPLAPAIFRHWADFGAGGGFPGLVIAVLAAEKNPTAQVTLVESDQRKATFLRQAIAHLGVTARVVAERVEAMDPLGADVVSARALAPLDQLCGFAFRHLVPGGVALFPKGESHDAEIQAARRHWRFHLNTAVSQTDPRSVIVILKDLSHA